LGNEMTITGIVAAVVLVALAIVIQWRDCVRDYGNTMGVYGLINTLWLLAGVGLAFGLASSLGWPLAIVSGVVLFALYYPITSQIERIGVKYGPRKEKKDAQQGGGEVRG
jgi:lipoprotein signal peptidase